MIRRYTLLGGAIALVAISFVAFSREAAPGSPAWLIVLVAIGLGCLLAWPVARRDSLDLRKIRQVVESLTEGSLWRRTRLLRPGDIGDLGRGLDELAEHLSTGETQERRREDRLQTILDAMAEAVMVTDVQGRIALSNEVLTDLVGFDPRGRTATEAIRHPDLHRAIEKAQQGYSGLLEIEIDEAGSARRVLRASVSPLRQRQGTVAVFHDVTEARAADRVRRDFVANANHELRTPLTAIRGFAETLRGGAIDNPESAREFLDIILRHTGRLQALVDDLADLSRFEGEDLELDLGPVDAGALLDEVLRGLESQSNAKKLTVTVSGLEDAPAALAEERALEQVLVNLADNAIKYTPEGGEVRAAVESSGKEVTVWIQNSGPGIPQKHLSRIFERFYRVDAGRSRELGGTGLGLSIVKHLVAKMGGRIRVDSSGGWTRFELRLRRADSPKSDTVVSRS